MLKSISKIPMKATADDPAMVKASYTVKRKNSKGELVKEEQVIISRNVVIKHATVESGSIADTAEMSSRTRKTHQQQFRKHESDDTMCYSTSMDE